MHHQRVRLLELVAMPRRQARVLARKPLARAALVLRCRARQLEFALHLLVARRERAVVVDQLSLCAFSVSICTVVLVLHVN
jgi:hypothetical protein